MTTSAPPPGRAPKRIRQALSDYEPGAHMYATFGTHWKGGAASLIPFAVLFFTTQPFGDAMALLTTGGYTIGPGIVVIFATGWAGMSYVLLHFLRFKESVSLHYVLYAIVGAVVLLVVALGMLTLVYLADTGTAAVWNSEAFVRFLIGAPLIGAMGSVIGRRTIASGVHWNVWLDRRPLPPVFDFVEGKKDKDDFERM